MNNQYFIKQLDEILQTFSDAKSRSQYSDFSDLDEDVISSLTAKAKSAIVRITGTNSEYYKHIQKVDGDYIAEHYRLAPIMGVIDALRSDIQNNYLQSLVELIRSEVFANYIDMARYLVYEGYKDPAAVLIGSTLEAHLRELCNKYSIDIEKETSKGDVHTKKASEMNSELYKVEAYSLTKQKQITAWLDLRNNAAHGKYDQYTVKEVRLMIDGIENFIISNPA